MTEIEQIRSLSDLEEQTAEGAREMSAAQAEVRIAHLLRKAFRFSGLSQADLATALEISEGRVSQVLNSSGNVRVATAARFLRAMGYKLEIEAIPVGGDVPEIRRPKRRRGRQAGDAYVHAWSGDEAALLFTAKPVVGDLTSGFRPIGVVRGVTANSFRSDSAGNPSANNLNTLIQMKGLSDAS